jgi:ABC-type spermidine/putrescine transport system permease subunit I
MDALDERLLRAAAGLGARAHSVAVRIVLPLLLPGLLGAGLLVFVVSAGFFITPVVLGAPSDMMAANLVDYYVHELVDFNAAAALAVLTLAAILPLVLLQQSLRTEGQYGEG